MNVLKNVLRGIACGVFFVSAFFWSVVLVFRAGGTAAFAVVFFCALLTNMLTGFLLAADCRRHIFYRWLVSLPAGAASFFIYREIGFIYYWLNQIHPGYGNLSAGGGFAVLFYLTVFCLCFPAAVAVAAVLTKRRRKDPGSGIKGTARRSTLP